LRIVAENVGEPCVYPKCDDGNGNPILTTEGICKGHQKQYRKVLKWIVQDWVFLHDQQPAPTRRHDTNRQTSNRVYGHPAEWASDMAALIAAALNETHDDLAEIEKASPAPHPGTSEGIRVRAAWDFIECRVPELCRMPGAGDIAKNFIDLHGRVRNILGLSAQRYAMAMPCPNCQLRTLYRQVDRFSDSIECGTCGNAYQEDQYRFLSKLVVEIIVKESGQVDA
jgi:hypothetical protein